MVMFTFQILPPLYWKRHGMDKNVRNVPTGALFFQLASTVLQGTTATSLLLGRFYW